MEEETLGVRDPIAEREQARIQLFEKNGITEEEVSKWKKAYGNIGWVSFVFPGIDYAVVFVYRSLTRKDWKETLRPKLQQFADEDLGKEIFCSYMLLHPKEAKEPEFWETGPAFIPETLETIIMDVSGSQPLTAPSRV